MLALTPPTTADASTIDAGSTAWKLTSCALVRLIAPGLAMFYGGLVRRKNVLSTMMHSFLGMAVLGVQWIVIGYVLCFGADHAEIIGFDWDKFCLSGNAYNAMYGDKHIPELVFVMFQGKFAIITPALISGAVTEWMKLSSYVLFILLWSTLISCPLAHWVWGDGGWLLNYGVLDFAGGTVVHVSSGVAALVMAMMIGRRRSVPNESMEPGNLILTVTGAGFLWFGWFGFNAGSAIAAEAPAAGPVAGLAFATTQTAAAAGALSWIVDRGRVHANGTLHESGPVFGDSGRARRHYAGGGLRRTSLGAADRACGRRDLLLCGALQDSGPRVRRRAGCVRRARGRWCLGRDCDRHLLFYARAGDNRRKREPARQTGRRTGGGGVVCGDRDVRHCAGSPVHDWTARDGRTGTRRVGSEHSRREVVSADCDVMAHAYGPAGGNRIR